MDESYQQSSSNCGDDLSTLRIKLIELSSVASAVLSSGIKYETLEIVGGLNSELVDCEIIDKFWNAMGRKVAELVVYPTETLSPLWTPYSPYETNRETQILRGAQIEKILNYFVDLRKIKIDIFFLQFLSPQFYIQNKELELIEILDDNSSRKFCIFDYQPNVSNWEVLPEFENIFKNVTSLKKITFPCRLPYNGATFSELTAYFTSDFLRVDVVTFDLEFLTFNTGCYITKMEIENDDRKAVVKAIDIKILDVRQNEEFGAAQMNACYFEHSTFLSRSVLNIFCTAFQRNVCVKCLKCMIKSFPNCLRFFEYVPLDSAAVKCIADGWVRLVELQLTYSGKLELFPDFNQLKCLIIELADNQTPDGILHLVRSCQNLDKFRITFRYPFAFNKIYADAIVASIAKHLIYLKVLQIDFQIFIGSQSLQLICSTLKQLKEFSLGYRDNPRDLFELFKQLPQLDSVKYKSNMTEKTITRQDYLYDSYETETFPRDPIEILPGEIWTNIFQRLHHNERLNCRRVCKTWCNILNAFDFLRELKIGNCTLAYSRNPVKIFSKSQLNCNRLLLLEPIIVCNEDFSEFWRNLGESITAIRFGINLRPDAIVKLVDFGMAMENFKLCESITFDHFRLFFDLNSYYYDYVSPMLKNIKKLTITVYDLSYVSGICRDMPNLNYVKVIVYSIRPLRLFLRYLIGHCPNVLTLHIVFEYEPIPYNVSRITSYVSKDKVLNVEEMELSLRDWKGLQTLSIYTSGSFIENVNICGMAIRLFQLLPKLNDLSFITSASNKIRYKLEWENDCLKNIVESKCSYRHISKTVVYSETTVKRHRT